MGIVLKVIIILGVFVTSVTMAQEDKVDIFEKKSGKRTVLMAENKTADTLSVFLMVHAEGYRRSADKPILKNLAPHSKTPMTTLIALDNVPSSYTYDLIVNEDLNNDIHVSQEKEVVDIENAIKGKLVIFRMTVCEKCDALISLLQSKRIQHRVFNIENDGALYAQFMSFIDKELTSETRIRFPVIWNKNHTIFGYDEVENLLKKLEN